MYNFPFDVCAYVDADDHAPRQKFTVITNAKWSDALSGSCDGKHRHSAGKYFELPWLFCVAHAKALGAADKFLKAAHRDNVVRHETNFLKTGSASLTNTRPDYPLVVHNRRSGARPTSLLRRRVRHGSSHSAHGSRVRART